MYLQNAVLLKNKYTEKLNSFNKQLLTIFPVSGYIDLLNNRPQLGTYAYVSPQIKDICNRIVHLANENILETYHKLILIELICLAKAKIENKNLHEDINCLYTANFNRILKQMETVNEPGFYLYSHDKFFKDLGICSFFLIPAGAQKIHLDTLPYYFLYKKGIRQFFKGICLLLFELKGIRPLFQMHTDSNDSDLMADFNSTGWENFYIRTARILEQQEDIKGIFGSSWFFDPQLSKISPRLEFLRNIVEQGGGKVFYIGTSSHDIKNALLKSTTRRKLYNAGKYLPANHIVIWPRQKLIEWAKKKSIKKPIKN